MLDYLEENNLLVEEQNGFRKGRSCLDHIFVLHSVITAKLKEKKSVYACFIDFSSAYDFVNRDLLLYALRSIGIEGKMLGIIKAFYTGTQSAVKINQKMTEWFNTYAGVRQGQNDSSTLFIIFLNSLAVKLKSLNIGVNIGKVNVTLLLYADDIVILSENEADIQSLLNETEKWCYQWRMKINSEKTQIVHFRPKRTSKTKEVFRLGKVELQVVSSYRYLGCTFDEFLNEEVTANTLAEGAGRALGKVLSMFYHNKGLGFRTYSKLYESCICPIMEYGSGVWGYSKNEKLCKIYLRAARCFLGVNKYAPLPGIEGDMGWDPPVVRCKIEMLRLWNRLVGMNDQRMPKLLYNHMLTQNHPWIAKIKNIFNEINCADVFSNNVPIINFKEFSDFASKSLMTHVNNVWVNTLSNKPKLHLYKEYKTQYCTERYVLIGLRRSQRSVLAKLRLGVLQIHVETGRYKNTPRDQRCCLICNINGEVEDEIHFLLKCPQYKNIRDNLFTYATSIIPEFDDLNEIQKLRTLTSHPNLIRNTANYAMELLRIRQNILRVK